MFSLRQHVTTTLFSLYGGLVS